MIQCVDIFVLDLLISCEKAKVYQSIQLFFSPNNYEKNEKTILKYFQ